MAHIAMIRKGGLLKLTSINQFAKISRADLVCACGVSPEPIVYRKIALLDNHAKTGENSTIEMVEKKEYEYHVYGDKHSLCCNAIKLYLVLNHFVDSKGFCPNISFDDVMGIYPEGHKPHIKTLKSNLERLSTYNYISYAMLDKDHFGFCVCSYQKMFLTAAQGGTGYHIFEHSLLDSLLKYSKVSLIISLRAMLHIDKLNHADACEEQIDYKTMRRWLPPYCKKNVINKAVTAINDIFMTAADKKKILFSVKEHCQSKRIRRNLRDVTAKELRAFFEDFTKELSLYCSGKDSKYKELFDSSTMQDEATGKKIMADPTTEFTSDSSFMSAVNLAVDYTVDVFKKAFLKLYQLYYTSKSSMDSVTNAGGLLRTIIESDLFDSAFQHDERYATA